MARFYTIIAIIAVSLALVAAGPAQRRQSKRTGALRVQSVRKSARQEVAPTPAAPYPPAGVTPEIPFDLPTETEKPFAEPDQTYGPPEAIPDETYGPPEAVPDETYGPPEEATPDQTYGPPDATAADEPAITEPDSTYGPPEAADADDQPAIVEPEAEELQNLIQPRRKLSPSRGRSSALRVRPAPIQRRGRIVEIVRAEPVLVYTLH
ncbi:uncharacterized protein LOC106084738 [Stomoxys calcitrans]|uniref:uncharacterized protein LOC106084738 n=1 Tax=Stomoxys calcitrans TaxID=35570 RepID=UPI0027E21AF6|nr:uncharacterized protein LOC106084738 [Stomoxys calcitrans]